MRKKQINLEPEQIWDPLPHMPSHHQPFVVDKVLDGDGQQMAVGHPEGEKQRSVCKKHKTIIGHYRLRQQALEPEPRIPRRRCREVIYAHQVVVGQVWTPINKYGKQPMSPVVILDKSSMSAVVQSIDPPVRKRPMMLRTLRMKYEFAADSIEAFRRMTTPAAATELPDVEPKTTPPQMPAALEGLVNRFVEEIAQAIEGSIELGLQRSERRIEGVVRDAVVEAMQPYDAALRSLIED